MGAKKKTSKTAKVKKAASSLGKMISGKKGGGVRRSRKKSALWYAKEIQRIRLKRKYEKVKFKV